MIVICGTGMVLGLAMTYKNIHCNRMPQFLNTRTLVDAQTVQEATELVHKVIGNTATHLVSSDVLCDRLRSIFVRFPPSEQTMRCLSVLQQRYSGSGGADEFILTTVYAAATIAIADRPQQEKRTILNRRHSL